MKPWPVAIVTDGNVSCGAVVWRFRQRLCMTVVAKASFFLAHVGIAAPIAPAEVTSEDLAPYLGRCDITLTGFAHAPGGRSSAAVRLAIFRDSQPLLDKTLHVFGDRDPSGAPRSFTQMPIVYERALGGPTSEANPLGTGAPNLLDPRDPSRPAGFGPIPRHWPVRMRLLAGMDQRQLEDPILDIPDAMRWPYFQAAPPDQQVDFLRGDEWIVLDGLHSSLPRLQTRLMRPSAEVFIIPHGGAPEASVKLALVADMLSIDTERQQCTIAWRGRHDIAGGEVSLSSLQVYAGLSLPGRPVVWAQGGAAARGGQAGTVAWGAPAPETTAAIGGEQVAAVAARPVAPFALAPPRGAPAPAGAEATPWGQTPLLPAPAPTTEGTLALVGGQVQGIEGTLALHPGVLPTDKPVAPFAIAAPGRAAETLNTAATPWGDAPLAAVPPPAASEETLGLSPAAGAALLAQITQPAAAPPAVVPPPIAPPPVAQAAAAPPAIAPSPVAPPPAALPPVVPPPPDANPAPAAERAPAPVVADRRDKPIPASPRPADPPAMAAAPAAAPRAATAPAAAPPAPHEQLAGKLRSAGASAQDIAALLAALKPPPPPPDDDD